MKWFTSDWHLGHANIIKLCDRPFDDVDTMNQTLMANCARAVVPGDEFWFVGDAALGKKGHTMFLEFVAGLPAARKVMVSGNHDPAWKGPHQATSEVFDEVYHRGEVAHTTVEGIPVAVSHLPAVGDSTAEERYAEWRPSTNAATPLVCGHVHEQWLAIYNQINVGVDQWLGAMVGEAVLAGMIRALGLGDG